MKKVVLIGGGFGGLTAAAELARAGLEVTLLEAHIYAGGCAGTFYYQGYRFDAGATLAGGFTPRAPMDLLSRRFGIQWGERHEELAMVVHLPDGSSVRRWTEHDHWKDERLKVFGPDAEPFWLWQERTADLLWDFAMRLPEWPPITPAKLVKFAKTGLEMYVNPTAQLNPKHFPGLFPDLFRKVDAHLNNLSTRMQAYIDGQLLISAQATSRSTNALYGAAALDLARRGIASVPGGMGGMAEKLVDAIRKYGGKVYFRKEVSSVQKNQSGGFKITTRRNEEFNADTIIFNLTPWNIAPLLSIDLRSKISLPRDLPSDAWGAFTLYLGVNSRIIPEGMALHHQILKGGSFGEGKSLFLSISPEWDASRTPPGKRAITVSTHTRLKAWWDLFTKDMDAYERRKADYTSEIVQTIHHLIPGIEEEMELVLSGTPITFHNFTRRIGGWVGGFPQTNLFRMRSPRLSKNMWMVGDSIFPGQSIPAVSLGGLRVAQSVLEELIPDHADCFQSTSMLLEYS